MHKDLFLIRTMLKNGKKIRSTQWEILLSLKMHTGVLLKNWNQLTSLVSLIGQRLITTTLKKAYCLILQIKPGKLMNTIIRKLLI